LLAYTAIQEAPLDRRYAVQGHSCDPSKSRIYTVGQKTAPRYFCNNFAKMFYSEIIIGTYIL